jgi:hypothetical protein
MGETASASSLVVTTMSAGKPANSRAAVRRVAITIIGAQFRGVLTRLFGAAIELHKEAKARAVAPIAPVAIRTEAPARAGGSTPPLLDGVVATALGCAPGRLHKREEDAVDAERVSQVTREMAPAQIGAEHSVMTGGGARWEQQAACSFSPASRCELDQHLFVRSCSIRGEDHGSRELRRLQASNPARDHQALDDLSRALPRGAQESPPRRLRNQDSAQGAVRPH